MLDVLKLLGPEKPKTEEEVRGLPNGFSVAASGVYLTPEQTDEDEEPKSFRICSKLEVISIVQSRGEDESGLEIAWREWAKGLGCITSRQRSSRTKCDANEAFAARHGNSARRTVCSRPGPGSGILR